MAGVKPSKISRKKFATPPVKVACLECRASRTRCDGGKPECANCSAKNKICTYTQSKRGGSRIRKKKKVLGSEERRDGPIDNSTFNPCPLSILPEDSQEAYSETLSMVTPGGGLRQLDFYFDDTDYIFDSIFSAEGEAQDSGYETPEKNAVSSGNEASSSYIRVYSCEEDILGAYYTYIHAYFPVLPPPDCSQVYDNPEIGIRRKSEEILCSPSVPSFEPSTPITLAISALLALIPHPLDPNSSAPESVQARREQAHAFASSAFESIEIESELVESVNRPGEALSSEQVEPTRKQFHERNPVENEGIIALLILGTYEYSQRGNIGKLRSRAGQAFNKTMEMGLHMAGDKDGWSAEADRRVWWMSYITVCQGSILSNSPLPVLLYDPRFTTIGPTIAADPEAWSMFLESQQVIATSTQFVIDLDTTLKSKAHTDSISQRMIELDNIIERLTVRADTWVLESSPPAAMDAGEMKVAQALRGIARIKLNSARVKIHRYCAFADLPIFTKKHCDLKSSGPATSTASNPGFVGIMSSSFLSPPTASCSCSTELNSPSFPSPPATDASTPEAMDSSTSTANINGFSPISTDTATDLPNTLLPFSSHFSAKVCMKSAFNIARSFQSLPFPDPIPFQPSTSSAYPPPFMPLPLPQLTSSQPRMIPIFACCAMQSSYALIMLSYKTKAMASRTANSRTELQTSKLLSQLKSGLSMVLEALGNYSLANEALGGMRDQIESTIANLDVPVDATA